MVIRLYKNVQFKNVKYDMCVHKIFVYSILQITRIKDNEGTRDLFK